MNTTDASVLQIDELSTRLVGVARTADAQRWLDTTVHAVVDDHLPRALAASTLPAGLWFIRELDLALVCRGISRFPDLAPQYAQAVLDTLTRSIGIDSEWIHFDNEVQLLAAFLVDVIATRTDNAWIWLQAGLINGLPDMADPARCVPVALSRLPHTALHGFAEAVARRGVPAIDRALGDTGWTAVATVIGAPAFTRTISSNTAAVARVFAKHIASDRKPTYHAATTATATDRAASNRTVADSEHVLELLRRSSLAASFRDSRLRPSHPVATAWAWLIVQEVEPALAESPAGPSTVSEIAGRLIRRLRADEIALSPPQGDLVNAAGTLADPRPIQVDPPDAIAERPLAWSQWAGLPYLLATAADAGLPDCIDRDPVLSQRGLRWSLWYVGTLLTGAPADDPAVLALAGLNSANAADLLAERPANPAERRSVARLASRWRRITVSRLRAVGTETLPSSLPAQLLDWLIHRGGHIDATPGWIDVVFPVATVELAIRRAALDLDPGFVPWLGTVVTFRYE
ncbi:hypothetical protein [Kribbella sp. CA-247076]|uniref:hypothetical protein n=1 Tax=Kribbella sp. CA-247076 TaxID=3239941 RepID=UPI003D8F2204